MILMTHFFMMLNYTVLGIKYWIANNDLSSIKHKDSFNFCLVQTFEVLSSCIDGILQLTIWFSFVFASRQYFRVYKRQCHNFIEHICGVRSLWKHEKENKHELQNYNHKKKIKQISK